MIINDRIELLDYSTGNDDRPVRISDKSLILRETSEQGRAELTVGLRTQSIHFAHLDKDKGLVRFIKCKSTADHLIIEKSENDNEIRIHIVEIKRSIGASTWKKMKEQFLGALIRAYELCGLLGVSFKLENVCAYSAFCFDRFRSSADLSEMHVYMHERGREIISDWNSKDKQISLFNGYKLKHTKVNMIWDDSNKLMTGSIEL